MLFRLTVRRSERNNRMTFVVSILDQEEFSVESTESVKEMLLGSSFKAMVTGYHYDNTPFIQLTPSYGPVGSMLSFLPFFFSIVVH